MGACGCTTDPYACIRVHTDAYGCILARYHVLGTRYIHTYIYAYIYIERER